MFVSVVITIHIVVCVVLVVVILVQQGKGAEIGAVFGGASSTTFGSNSGGSALTKATWALATVFFATSIFLAYASTQRVTGSIFSGAAVHTRPVMPASNPVIPAPVAPTGNAPVPPTK